MEFKDESIDTKNLQPQLVLALMMAQEVYNGHGVDLVITSLNDAAHSRTSLHYSGNAVDLRTHNLPDGVDPNGVAAEIRQKLNKDFDVIFEGDHIHLEHQPKRR